MAVSMSPECFLPHPVMPLLYSASSTAATSFEKGLPGCTMVIMGDSPSLSLPLGVLSSSIVLIWMSAPRGFRIRRTLPPHLEG